MDCSPAKAGVQRHGRNDWVPASAGTHAAYDLVAALRPPPRADHVAGLPRAVMAPARLAHQVSELRLELGRAPGVEGHHHPFVQGRPEQIVGAERLDDAVARRILVALRIEAAEHLVPD